MAREGLYTAIDLGTSKVVTLIASVRPDGGLLIHGVGEAPSEGMQKGRVVDVAAAQDAVWQSLDQAQRDLGRPVSWAYLGVSGSHITCLNNNVVSHRGSDGSTLKMDELVTLIAETEPQVPPGKELLHHITMDFVVDGFSGVRSPEGLEAETIEVHTHSVMGDTGPLENARRAVEGCKIEVRNLVTQPLASGEAVLTQDEQEVGVVLVDIGGGTADVIVYRGGHPWYTTVIPVGGYQLTRDMAVALGGAPYSVAEQLKQEFGHALPSTLDTAEEIPVPAFFGKPPSVISRKSLCEALHERALETLELVLEKVRQAGLRELPPAGLVLTGGSAELPGLGELAQKVFNGPTRIGTPRSFPGLPGHLRKPAYAASVGALLWGIKHQGQRRRGNGRAARGEPGRLGRLLHLGKRQ